MPNSITVQKFIYQIYLISFYFTPDIVTCYISLSVENYAYVPDKKYYDAVFVGTYDALLVFATIYELTRSYM